MKYFIIIAIIFSILLNCSNKKDKVQEQNQFTQQNRAEFGGIGLVVGSAWIYKNKLNKWDAVKISLPVEYNDSIKTDSASQIEITFDDNNTMRIGEKSKICIAKKIDSSNTSYTEVYNSFGTVLSNIKKLVSPKKSYRVITPTAVASIRGTFFEVSFDASSKSSNIAVIEGKVWARNPHIKKELVITYGNYANIGWRVFPLRPQRIQYAHWMKMKRLMSPKLFEEHSGKLKFKEPQKRTQIIKRLKNPLKRFVDKNKDSQKASGKNKKTNSNKKGKERKK